MSNAEQRITHPLATRGGIAYVHAYLLFTGAMCPKCQYGTRVTSKRWARCKKCGERVARRTESDFTEMLERAGSAPHKGDT